MRSHVAVVIEGEAAAPTKLKFYIDGNAAGQFTTGAPLPSGSTFALSLGAGNSSTATPAMYVGRLGASCNCVLFHGLLDEIRLWDQALTQKTLQQWAAYHINGLHKNFHSLVFYYKFDIGYGDTAEALWVASSNATGRALTEVLDVCS